MSQFLLTSEVFLGLASSTLGLSSHPQSGQSLLSAGGARAGCRGMGRWDAWVPTAMGESQAAIWLPLAQGGRGLCGAGPVAGWGQGCCWGRLRVWDDSGPMITACAYLGSVNRRGRGRRRK